MAKKNTYQKYETDQAAEENGQLVEFSEGVIIGVRAMRSQPVREQQAIINRRNQRFYRSGASLPSSVQDQDAVDLCVAIISEWEGVTDRSGVDLVYNETNVRRVMTDLSDLREQVITAATMAETFRKEALKAATENLSPASVSSSGSRAQGALES